MTIADAVLPYFTTRQRARHDVPHHGLPDPAVVRGIDLPDCLDRLLQARKSFESATATSVAIVPSCELLLARYDAVPICPSIVAAAATTVPVDASSTRTRVPRQPPEERGDERGEGCRHKDGDTHHDRQRPFQATCPFEVVSARSWVMQRFHHCIVGGP